MRAKARVIPITPAEDDSLYEVRQKVYPRAVSGVFANWRWAMVWLTQIVFYGFCWLPWNGRQAVLFHLAERKFYIFGFVFWPQDVFYLAVLLIISAYSLFLFTTVAGRLWCGFTCPQTVYTEMFLWIEKLVEGDRAKRMKLDQSGGARKLGLKSLKYFLWAALSLWTGITFVGYFTPVLPLMRDIASWQLSGWEIFWVLFYGGFTYLMAGVMREQVCKYMCPYARFQSVMFDADTLVITYDQERGDPRGSRRKGEDYKAAGKGDCVDCGICVQVCPTGIDIRNGLQYDCIGCAACIDACDQVMDKMDYPKGLIRYSTENAVRKHWGRADILRHVLRPRVLIYSAILWAIIGAFIWGLATRSPVRVNVIKDRTTLAREVEGGFIENIYVLQLMNTSETEREFRIGVSGLADIRLDGTASQRVLAASNRTLTVHVRVPVEAAERGSHPIYFDVSLDDPEIRPLREKSVFIMP
ncbi:MAG: cytochrome c oxidase accessory protein CcoG [Rhodocyclaceae bacterium]